MTQQEIYDELRLLGEQLGLAVRIDIGDFDGGLCVMKDKRMILLNRRHDIARRISVLARALTRAGLNDIFVKPALREIIEEEVHLAQGRSSG